MPEYKGEVVFEDNFDEHNSNTHFYAFTGESVTSIVEGLLEYAEDDGKIVLVTIKRIIK